MSQGREGGPGASLRILRMPEVEARTGLSRRSIQALVRKGTFPQPIRLSRRAVGWLESEVSVWNLERVARSREGVE